MWNGGGHPALLCAALYARIAEWEAAAAITEGFVALGELGAQAAARIEAWRLLAKCRASLGDSAAAKAALESGAAEARAPGYVWLEACCLRELAALAGAEEEAAALQGQIEALSAGFRT